MNPVTSDITSDPLSDTVPIAESSDNEPIAFQLSFALVKLQCFYEALRNTAIMSREPMRVLLLRICLFTVNSWVEFYYHSEKKNM